MNILILADIQDVMHSPHPVFGIPLGVGLFILAIYKLFSSNQAPPPAPPKNDFPTQNIPTRYIPPKRLDDIPNTKPDHEVTEKLPVKELLLKEQLLSDLRRLAEKGILTKEEYEVQRDKVFNMPNDIRELERSKRKIVAVEFEREMEQSFKKTRTD
ncbi:MAG TPA: hypothetical protein VIK59_07375 [Verrucomicrobiae bacterium]